jgi:hypothetical protein
MFTSLFISLILPIQVHPISYDTWSQSPAPMLQAIIDAARIIGLPRLKTMDSSMYRTIYINEIQSGPIYRVYPRGAFIREYLK